MLISLQLVATPQGPVTDAPARRFDEELITIGRAPNCDVVLPDGLRIISRQHVRIEARGGTVKLCCLSASAPVQVGGATVVQGGVMPVRSGERIRIGGFELLVGVEDGPASGVADATDGADAADAETALDLLLPEPAGTPPTPAGATPTSPAAASARPAAPPRFAAPAQPAPPGPASPARGRLDQWFDLDAAAALPPDSAPGATSAAFDTNDSGAADDLRADAGSVARDRASPPAADAPAAGVPAPESSTDPRPTALPFAPPVAPSVAPSVAPVPESPPPAPRSLPAGIAPAAAGPGPPASPGSGAPTSLPPHAPDALRDELLAAFLDGAGLTSRTSTGASRALPPMQLTPEWMHRLGELMRAGVDGVLALLHSRSAIKREMRAEVTVIARRQNNPLKFAPDATAAVAHLVSARRSPGFLDPVAAVKDAHEDLLVHHLAVVAGMRAAMFDLIQQVGPEAVMYEEGSPKGLAASIPTLHEAALWRRHCQRHRELLARLDDDFEAVFGSEFTKAYEAQAKLVREQAPPEGPTG